MSTLTYSKYIAERILNWPTNAPITTAKVSATLADYFGIDIESAKNTTNVNMKRLADKGELIRIQKGVYGKVKDTPFGKLTPNADKLITVLFLRDGDKTIGYITGPTLLNAIGLYTWMPKDLHIATNHYRRQLPAGVKIRVHKPVAEVNNDNAQYLQALEMFTAMEQYHIDAEKPYEILCAELRRNNLNNERLIWYARKHCGQKALLRIIDVSLGESKHETP